MVYLRLTLEKTVITLDNTGYSCIFSNKNIPFFITMSSSLGVEAKYTGYKCYFLIDEPTQVFSSSKEEYMSNAAISHAILDENIWRELFFKEPRQNQQHNDAFIYGDHYLRDSLNQWSYKTIRSGLLLDPICKIIYPSNKATKEKLFELKKRLGAAPIENKINSYDNTHSLLSKQLFSWGSIEIMPPPFNLNIDYEINFNETSSSYYLYSGFHNPEQWGTWSSNKSSILFLPVNNANKKELQITIILELTIFEALLNEAPIIIIKVNNKMIGMIFFRTETSCSRTIKFTTTTRSSLCKLELVSTHVASPKDVKISTDDRVLGYSLISMRIFIDDTIPKKTAKRKEILWIE